MNTTALQLIRYKTWSTLRLIEFCDGLDPELLHATAPGTYGSVRETLRHLVNSEEGYLYLITGQRPAEPLPESVVPLGELASRIRTMAPRWEDLATQDAAADRVVESDDGWRMPAALPMAQAILHAYEHRTHILSILGAHGVESPLPNNLDAWGFAEDTALMTPVVRE